jgi:transcriptional antiterminator RfaH
MTGHLNLWQKTSWFAIQTKARQEQFAAACVVKLDVEVFLPQAREEQWVCSRNVTKALFPGYFFARFCPLESLEAIRYAPGVSRVVGSGRFPTAVAPEIIARVQEQIQPDGFIRLKARRLNPGEKVTVEQGPFQGWIGEVQRELNDGKRVMILLEAIQHARLLVERGWLTAGASA